MMGENSSRIANKLIEAKANMATTNVARRAIACLIDLGFMRTIHTNNAGAMPRTSVWNHNPAVISSPASAKSVRRTFRIMLGSMYTEYLLEK